MVKVKSRAHKPAANRLKVESSDSKPESSKIRKESSKVKKESQEGQQPSNPKKIKVEKPPSTSPSLHSSSPARKTKHEPPSPVETTTTITPRGRPQARQTSSKRISLPNQANQVRRRQDSGRRERRRRDPLTPTTQAAISRERKFRRMVRQREREAEMERVLGREETYYRVLRSGRRWRVFGGVRAR